MNIDIIEAHNGSVCSIASHENLLYTGSNKFFKVWSLDNMECISEIESHASFIKTMVMWPEHSLILTGCNNEIAI
jgi:WD40 repeat protein